MIRAAITGLRERRVLLRIAGNSAWLLGEQLLRAVLGAIVGAMVARHLGPGSFGTLSIVFAYLMLFGSISGLGIGGILVRDLIREPAMTPRILGTALGLRLGASLLVWVAGVGIVMALDTSPYELTMLLAVASGALLFQSADVIDFLLQSQLRGRALAITRACAFVASSGARLIFIAMGAPLLLFASAPMIEAIVAAMLLVLIFAKYGARPRSTLDSTKDAPAGSTAWRFDILRAKALLKASLPVALSGFLVIGIMQVDKLMLDRLAGAHAVGIYAAAAILSAAWYTVPVIIGGSVAPTLTALHDHDRTGYERKLRSVFAAVTLMALCVGAVGTVLSGALISLFFGRDYADAAPVLMIHIWTGVFVANVSIRTRALMIENGAGLILLFSALALVSNVALNALLIPRYAEVGAAWATLLSWALSAAVFPLLSPRSRAFSAMMLGSFRPGEWLRALRR